jgi:DNA-binding MarR family transcriptional regulator
MSVPAAPSPLAAPPPAPPSIDSDVHEFSAAMEDFARAWRRARMRLRADDGLSIAQYHLVEPLLDIDAPLGVGELAATAGVAAPTATRMLDALVRDGICERARDDADRRCVKVSLTDAGRRAAGLRRARNDERRRQIHASLSPDERRDAARLLRRLADAIEEL